MRLEVLDEGFYARRSDVVVDDFEANPTSPSTRSGDDCGGAVGSSGAG